STGRSASSASATWPSPTATPGPSRRSASPLRTTDPSPPARTSPDEPLGDPPARRAPSAGVRPGPRGPTPGPPPTRPRPGPLPADSPLRSPSAQGRALAGRRGTPSRSGRGPATALPPGTPMNRGHHGRGAGQAPPTPEPAAQDNLGGVTPTETVLTDQLALEIARLGMVGESSDIGTLHRVTDLASRAVPGCAGASSVRWALPAEPVGDPGAALGLPPGA